MHLWRKGRQVPCDKWRKNQQIQEEFDDYCDVDESLNPKGANRCSLDSECEGARKCSGSGWCRGESGCDSSVRPTRRDSNRNTDRKVTNSEFID